jgi:hypothetical protein
MRHVPGDRLKWALVGALLVACGGEAPKPAPAGSAGAGAAASEETIGYELRRLRPRDGELLAAMFDRQRTQAQAEGKRVAVMFGADWCEPCRLLETELGNRHPASQIGDVRIFELKEEDWTSATRMDEFDALRRRWDSTTGAYPLMVLLDDKGGKREEMKDAISRLEAASIEPTLANWLADTRPKSE